MRLIDADKIQYSNFPISVFGNALYVTKAEIDAMPTVETEPQWIPVEERLPEEWEPVLAMIYIDELPDRPIIDTMWFIGNINGRNKWRVCWNSDMVESDVTHWMPLPDYHPNYDIKIDKKVDK